MHCSSAQSIPQSVRPVHCFAERQCFQHCAWGGSGGGKGALTLAPLLSPLSCLALYMMGTMSCLAIHCSAKLNSVCRTIPEGELAREF